mgnify:CR=1 FL=1
MVIKGWLQRKDILSNAFYKDDVCGEERMSIVLIIIKHFTNDLLTTWLKVSMQ